MRRLLSALAGLAAGALLAISGLIGTAASTSEPIPHSEPLELGRYCRHRYGDEAVVYRPAELEDWSCSAITNGVWGRERIDLQRACRWQRGEDAVVRAGPSERALTCTL
jgi:hypothetical protein